MKEWSPVLLAALLTSLLWGCSKEEGGGDDDDMVDDDDMLDDDDSADTTPTWSYYTVDSRFEAAGGVEGGTAMIRVQVAFHGEDTQVICRQSLVLTGEYTHGTNQSDELFEYTDQLVVPERVESSTGDCPVSLGTSAADLMDLSQWSLFPLAFVSCDSVEANPDLGAMYLVEQSGLIIPEEIPWTFENVCKYLGGAASYFYGLGEVEAIWLRPCSLGEFDEQANAALVYHVPRDTTHTEAWALSGFSHVGQDNASEPVEGLDGTYDLSFLWSQQLTVEG